jgi:hypothetical protein
MLAIKRRQQVVKRYFDKSTTSKDFQKINWFCYGTKKKKNHLFTQSLKLSGLAHIKLKNLLVTIHTC